MARRTQPKTHGVNTIYVEHTGDKKKAAKEIKSTSAAYKAGEDIDIPAVIAARTKRKSSKTA